MTFNNSNKRNLIFQAFKWGGEGNPTSYEVISPDRVGSCQEIAVTDRE
jgi:hypothetical protein